MITTIVLCFLALAGAIVTVAAFNLLDELADEVEYLHELVDEMRDATRG